MRRRIVLVTVALLAAATAIGAQAGGAVAPVPTADTTVRDATTVHGSGELLLVDADGEGYDTIQAAVAAADDGDTVRVMPGTYRERVTIAKNVTVVAPRGATLNGTGFEEGAAFHIQEGAAPVVAGFTVIDYPMGVDAFSAPGNWVVRNTTFVRAEILAVGATGDWVLRNVTVRDTGTAIEAGDTNGDWLVVDTVIRNVTEGDGIEASPTSGDWTVRNVTLTGVDFVGISASYSTGDWRVVNATVRRVLVGVGAVDASGNWTVRGSTIANVSSSGRYDLWQPPLTEGAGVDASGTNGSWAIHGTRFVRTDAAAIVADGATPPGDAAYNWFGGDGPAGECTGAVDCSPPLSGWPPTTPVPMKTTAQTTSPATTRDGRSPARTTGPATPSPTTMRSLTPPSTTVRHTHPPTSASAPLPYWTAVLATLTAGILLIRRRRYPRS